MGWNIVPFQVENELWFKSVFVPTQSKGVKLRHRLKEGAFCVSELAEIELTPARSGRAGYAHLNL
jgi:hypothetical protein